MNNLAHTVQIAYAVNVRVIDDQGLPVSAWLMPVLYWFLPLPAWVWQAPERTLDACAVIWVWLAGQGEALGRDLRGLWGVLIVARGLAFS